MMVGTKRKGHIGCELMQFVTGWNGRDGDDESHDGAFWSPSSLATATKNDTDLNIIHRAWEAWVWRAL